MISCPACGSSSCRRSRRHSFADITCGVVGLIPWRCLHCDLRFRARPLPVSHWRYAHCSICGNLDLERISPEHVPGTFGFLGRLLGLPSLRCDPCRHKFFSIRPMKALPSPEHAQDQQRVA